MRDSTRHPTLPASTWVSTRGTSCPTSSIPTCTEDGLIRLTLNIEDIPLGITEAIPCGLIINELVSNALKHAFPHGREGEITIQLQRAGANQIALTVSDNGVGFPEHVDFRKSPSLGLTLIKSLVEQLDGAIELDSREGTAFTVTFG